MVNKDKLFQFNLSKELILLFVLFILCWMANFIADAFLGTWLFYIFYHVLFAITCCIGFPLYYMIFRKNLPLQSVGFNSSNIKKAIFVGLLIAVITCTSRLFTLNIPKIPVDQIIYIVVAMVFSTLFEEVFFRGVLQSRFEKQFGTVIAIILSSLCFSLYHSAQSFIGFDFKALLTLFLVGIMFGISYKVTNSVLTAYIVNFPHAILTFLGDEIYLNYSYQNMNLVSTIITAIATIIALIIIIVIKKKTNLNSCKES